MSGFETEQEGFWAGSFGDEYTDRSRGEQLLASNTALFSRIFCHTSAVRSVIEFGANIGLNLVAIRNLLRQVDLSAVEINPKALKDLAAVSDVKVYAQSILSFSPDYPRDFVLTKGLLIHLDPSALPRAYDVLYRSAERYICLVEYYNPVPVELKYRGHAGRLFKRDFAGELLDRFEDLKVAAYGFVYHRDAVFPLDDLTWFLLAKTAKIQWKSAPSNAQPHGGSGR